MNALMRHTLFILLLIGSAFFSAASAQTRVITLGSDVTEIVFALGEEGRVVARDLTSTFPLKTADLPDVGYFRQLSAEGVLSLKPDLILATAAAGPPEVLKQVGATGVKVVAMPEGYTPDSLLRKVEIISGALGVEAKGKAFAEKLRAEIDAAKTTVASLSGRPKVLFIIAASAGSPMAAGTHTAADALLGLAGAENVFAAHTGYKAISLEAAAAAAPEAIAMMSLTLDTFGGMDGVTNSPALRLTPAVKAKRIVVRDGGYLLSFGPRLPQAMVDLARGVREEGKP